MGRSPLYHALQRMMAEARLSLRGGIPAGETVDRVHDARVKAA